MRKLNEYIAYISCDTSFLIPLEGKYHILKYTLEPCEIWEGNQHRGVSSFTLSFQFKGLPEKRFSESREWENRRKNRDSAIEEAKLFIAWLSVATIRPIDLSHQRFGGAQTFGPSSHKLLDEVNRDTIVKVHHIKKNAADGKYERVERPIYESIIRPSPSLRIPHDFPELSRKLYSLSDHYREMFFDSCLSYQFALINMYTIPSLGLVALVNVVESLMRDEYSSGYCDDAQKQCNLKRDAMKKFRRYFEDNLQFPLPREMRKFINDVYGSRSNFVHEALMGSGPYRGPMYSSFDRGRELKDQLELFKGLVNACMINWLERI